MPSIDAIIAQKNAAIAVLNAKIAALADLLDQTDDPRLDAKIQLLVQSRATLEAQAYEGVVGSDAMAHALAAMATATATMCQVAAKMKHVADVIQFAADLAGAASGVVKALRA